MTIADHRAELEDLADEVYEAVLMIQEALEIISDRQAEFEVNRDGTLTITVAGMTFDRELPPTDAPVLIWELSWSGAEPLTGGPGSPDLILPPPASGSIIGRMGL